MFVSQMAPKSILRKRYLKSELPKRFLELRKRFLKKVLGNTKKVFESEEGLRKQGQINIRPKLKV